MTYGYARVSTGDQTTDLQQDALEKAGCDRILTDVASGARTHRPELDHMLDLLREGDTVVVWKLDRLGRSMRNLVDLMTTFDERGVQFRSLTESIDTSTPGGTLVFNIFDSLAQFERDLIRTRREAGQGGAEAVRVQDGDGGPDRRDDERGTIHHLQVPEGLMESGDIRRIPAALAFLPPFTRYLPPGNPPTRCPLAVCRCLPGSGLDSTDTYHGVFLLSLQAANIGDDSPTFALWKSATRLKVALRKCAKYVKVAACEGRHVEVRNAFEFGSMKIRAVFEGDAVEIHILVEHGSVEIKRAVAPPLSVINDLPHTHPIIVFLFLAQVFAHDEEERDDGETDPYGCWREQRDSSHPLLYFSAQPSGGLPYGFLPPESSSTS